METLNEINVVATYALIYGGLPGQTLFLAIYWFRPWRKYRPTRALMSKSFSFWLLMSQSFIVLHMYGMRPLDWPWWLLVYRILGDIFMVSAIYYQLYALIREQFRAGGQDPMVPDQQ